MYAACLTQLTLFLNSQLEEWLNLGVPKEKCMEKYNRLIDELVEARNKEGYEALSGDISADGFEISNGRVKITDNDAAKRVIGKWMDEYFEKPSKETALRYECSLLVLAAGGFQL